MRAVESEYGFFQRVDDPACGRIRAALNAWFDRFLSMQEAEAVSDLRGRFQAKEDGQFKSAFWELYLHETFVRLGFDISVHPLSERGKRPDFVLRREHQRLYLEAVMLTPGFSGRNEPRNVQMVIEHVNEAFHPDFLLRLRYVIAGSDTPRKVAVRKEVSDWLYGLVWEDIWKDDMASSVHPEAEIEVGASGWKIGLTALPLPPESRSREKGPMIFAYQGFAGNADGLGLAILPGLYEKANKYGDLDAPHVIALWIMDAMASEDTAAVALFGSWFATEEGTHRTGLNLRKERPESLWSPSAKHRGRASAVLAANSFEFGYPAIARALPRLWLNPSADRPLATDLPFARSLVSGDEKTVENVAATTTASELFDLPNDWPGRAFQSESA